MDAPFLMTAEDLGVGPPPGSILLHSSGYMSTRTNATTAEGITKDGKVVKVTFWAAHPPRVSFFTVYFLDLECSGKVRKVIGRRAEIISMDDDLVLLRVPTYPSSSLVIDYFVYQAGTGNKRPSLELITPGPGLFFSDLHSGLLRCRATDTFFVAVLCSVGEYGYYDLHLYNSKSKTWSTRLVHLDSRQEVLYTHPSKVITIGGELGSIAWVDLWRGIVICDVLLVNSELRYIPLPSPLVPRPLQGPPLTVRDIIVSQGCINYFEMYLHYGPDGVIKAWEAAKWRSKDSAWEAATWRSKGSWMNWERICTIQVPPNLQEQEAEPKEQQPTLKGLWSGYPALSLHDSDVVYITDRNDLYDKRASVIAVDMRKQTVKDVAELVRGQPLGYSFIYLGSGISKHLHWTPSTRPCDWSKRSMNDARATESSNEWAKMNSS